MKNLALKEEIRQEILKKRLELDAAAWQSHTEAITRAVTSHDWFREATDIYCYIDCRKEAGTRQIIEEAWRLGKAVWAPKVRGAEMDFFEICSFDDLTCGGFGILEPEEGTAADGLDGLVIMPGVAFDKERRRIGYGKGYYDRYLTAHPSLHTLAIAFDLQIIDEAPQDEGDIRPQVLITETMTF